MNPSSLPFRAAVAVVLMIGFYALALGIVAALLALVWLDLTHARGRGAIAVFAAALAAMIVWAILPRRTPPFQPGGPRLDRTEQPELFDVIEDVARAANQKMPSEIYLTYAANAGVMQSGGILGIGSRRIMELGLPLLQSLTVSQFRAVIGHELGHYDGGDTGLGPFVCRTRAAIERTVEALADEDGVVHKPFEWYGRFYLRVTQAIARGQELAADRLGAKIAGARNMADALVTVRRTAIAYQAFCEQELAPLLVCGFRPPLAAGLAHYVRADAVRVKVDEAIDNEPETGVFDSHPPLRERLAAIDALPPGMTVAGEPPALALLRDVPDLERALAPHLPAVTWEDVWLKAWLPLWQSSAQRHADGLREVTPLALPKLARSLPDFSGRLALTPADGEQTQAAARIIGSAFAVRLHDLGWTCDAAPGRPIAFVRGDRTVQPFEVLPRLRNGTLTAEEWEAECRAAGIAEERLV